MIIETVKINFPSLICFRPIILIIYLDFLSLYLTTLVRPQVSGLFIPSKSFDFRNIQTSKSYLSTTPVHRRASQYNQQIQHTQQAYIMQPAQERVAVTDVWATCLSIVFNSSNLPTSCPMAIKSAWSILFQRISTIFPLIDPRQVPLLTFFMSIKSKLVI